VRGREAVRTALLDSATALFAARGVRAVSVREIAAAAGVNHGLVHRHFGSKEAVVRAVLDRSAREIAASAAAVGGEQPEWSRLFASLTERDAFWRILARAMLDGEDPTAMQSEFPVLRLLVDTFAAMQRRGALDRAFDPGLVAAGVAGLVMGWLVFEPFLVAGTDLGRGRSTATRQRLLATLLDLLGRMAPNPTVPHR